ncbi:hypothetical protein G9F31_12605 [Acinetobacter sp. 187]|uniref:hypothetical protein n=1 Tax=Acinetobacter lanii TaxID=2715163 RepID=UPI00140CAC05|nr:hypothetical protein [Acinetobacter lanii]NHC04594.1 hypothetical protein [Acinetobacter lanii]
MKKTIALLITTLMVSPVYALEALSDDALQNVEGQAGADLSLKLSINHKLENGKYVFDNGTGAVCADVQFCRLAVSVNNRFIDNNGQASSGDGYKLWLVFKGIQGTINIQKLGLDGMDLSYKDDGGADKIKAAMQLSFDATKPIEIRNFGFNALAFGQDKFLTTAGVEAGSTNASDYGYLQVTRYDTSNAPGSVYDHGRETGFMGVQMNGNLALQGKVMMFGCDASHPRC